MQTLPKGRGAGLALWIILRIVHQHCDPAHPLALLRARRERPRRHAAEKLNELAPPHRLASSNWAPSDYHTVARQDAAVRPEESAYANCFQALAGSNRWTLCSVHGLTDGSVAIRPRRQFACNLAGVIRVARDFVQIGPYHAAEPRQRDRRLSFKQRSAQLP